MEMIQSGETHNRTLYIYAQDTLEQRILKDFTLLREPLIAFIDIHQPSRYLCLVIKKETT